VTVGGAEPHPAALAAAVGRCRFGEVTSYLPGQRISGVAIGPAGVRVSVISTATATATSLVAEISAALAPLIGSCPVAITWADIALPLS
jgi:hypothetical protein